MPNKNILNIPIKNGRKKVAQPKPNSTPVDGDHQRLPEISRTKLLCFVFDHERI
jgi:hypothetical protein